MNHVDMTIQVGHEPPSDGFRVLDSVSVVNTVFNSLEYTRVY